MGARSGRILIVAGACIFAAALIYRFMPERPAPVVDLSQISKAAVDSESVAVTAHLPEGDAVPESVTEAVAEPQYGPDDAPALFQTASLSRACGDTDRAIALVRELQKSCHGTKEAMQGLLLMGEMANLGEAPSTLLAEAYEGLLTAGCEKWPEALESALPHFADMDALYSFKLHWKFVIGMAQAGVNRGRPFRVLLDAARAREGNDVIWEMLSTALSMPELQLVRRKCVSVVCSLVEEEQGPEAALAAIKQYIDVHPRGVASIQAMNEAIRLLKKTAGDKKTVEFMAELSQMDDKKPDGPGHDVSGDGTRVRKRAQRWLADYYLTRNNIPAAVAAFCASEDEILNQSADLIEYCATEVVNGLSRAQGRTSENITVEQILSRLGDISLEQNHPDLCGQLYFKAASRIEIPQAYLDANSSSSETMLVDEIVSFWRAYMQLRNGGEAEAISTYQALLNNCEHGRYASQMLFDMARYYQQQLRYAEATKWIALATSRMPENASLQALSQQISAGFQREQDTETLVVNLRTKLDSEVRPAAKAEICSQIAQAEVARGHLDEGIQVFREVWEKYPETSHAPIAMLTVAEIMVKRGYAKAEVDRVLVELVLAYPGDESAAKAQQMLGGKQGG